MILTEFDTTMRIYIQTHNWSSKLPQNTYYNKIIFKYNVKKVH